jgi:hypothetical protein
MTPDEAVERAARALSRIENQRQLDTGVAWVIEFKDGDLECDWEHYVDDARACIVAYLEHAEPTPKMLRAACKATSPDKRPTATRVSNSAKHGIRFRAMRLAELSALSKGDER